MSIRVVLVDDHKMLREGVKQLLEFDPQIVVCAQASTGEESKKIVANEPCDVVVLDINLPDCSGTKLLKELKKINKDVKYLMLSVHNEVEFVMEAVDFGANGYVLKEAGSTELIKAIKAVYSGERYIQADLVPALNARLLRRAEDYNKGERITKREKQILISIALGHTNKDIASEFSISERTVKNHITNIFRKINVTDRTQAAVFAIRNNYVNL